MILRQLVTSILGFLFLNCLFNPVLVLGNDTPPVQVKMIRYDSKSKGIIVELSAQTQYQMIQVDETEILLAFKNIQALGDVSPVASQDPLVKHISSGQMSGNILGLIIHTRNPVIHEKTEWMDNSSRLLIRLKS